MQIKDLFNKDKEKMASDRTKKPIQGMLPESHYPHFEQVNAFTHL